MVVQTPSPFKKINFLTSDNDALRSRQQSQQQLRPKGLSHLMRYEENKFLLGQRTNSHSQERAKPKDYLQEMKMKRLKNNNQLKSFSLLSSSGSNTLKAAAGGFTRTIPYNTN